MSESKKPTVSEIRAWIAVARLDHTISTEIVLDGIPYLLDLVERLGELLELLQTWLDNQPDGRGQIESKIVKEARALLDEVKK